MLVPEESRSMKETRGTEDRIAAQEGGAIDIAMQDLEEKERNHDSSKYCTALTVLCKSLLTCCNFTLSNNSK